MASITGKGILEPYSQVAVFPDPVLVSCLPELMKLPDIYRENIIAVRGGKVLGLHEMLYDDDEILVFVSVMGG